MSDYIWIDALEVGRAVKVPERTFVPPIPGETRKVTVQDWDGPSLKRGIEYIAHHKKTGGRIAVTGHADAWVILGLACSLLPECEIFYGAGLNGPGQPPVATPLLSLPMGEKNPALRFDCEMRTEGGDCFLDYRVDDPDAPPGVVHTFKDAELPQLVLPEIPAGKNLFLHAYGSYYVQMNVTHSYAKYAKSVWTAYHDSPFYYCAFSSVPEFSAGDSRPRKQFAAE